MTTVVFLGPSLDREQALAILPEALYLPPAGQGDLISVARSVRPDRIALVDGVFHHSLPVWHREILDALDLGVPVYGASSMGALRAAECAPFGMVGVGAVFEAYASGALTDDDEVAVAHTGAEHGWRAISLPMVDIRATLGAAVLAGRVAERWHLPVLLAAKRLWYPQRCLPALCAEATGLGMGAEELAGLRESFVEYPVGVKAADARLLLHRLAAANPQSAAPATSTPDGTTPGPARAAGDAWTLQKPVFYRALVERDRWVVHGEGAVRMARIAEYRALGDGSGQSQREDALNRAVALAMAATCGFEPTAEQVDAELLRLARRNGLAVEDLDGWASANDLSRSDLHRLAGEEATLRHLRGWLVQQAAICNGTGAVLDHLRLRGRYRQVAAAAAGLQQRLDQCRPDPADPLPRVETVTLLREHAAATGCAPDASLADWAESLGFSSVDELLRAMAEHRVVRQATAAQDSGMKA